MPVASCYINNELYTQAQDALSKHYEKVCELYGSILRKPVLSFNLSGTCAGKAYLLRDEIRLNPALYSQNVQFFLDETIPHELAHLVVYRLYGPKVKPHGAEWKSIMQSLGVKPNTTHDLDVSATKRKVPTVEYRCACAQPTLIPTARHRKVQSLRGRFVCRRCTKTLHPAS